MKTDDADVNGIHILFLREGALQVVTALKSDEVHVIWLRVDERVDSRVGTVDFPTPTVQYSIASRGTRDGYHWV
jgi:hypothetical protein